MDQNKEEKRLRGKQAMNALSARLVQIKAIRWKFTFIALVANVLIYFVLLAMFKGDFDKTVRVYTNSFQYQAVGYVAWFMFPYFLRMEAKQDVGMAMGHDSVDLMDKIDEAVAARTARVDEILAMAKKSFEEIEKGSHPVLENLKKYAREELEKLRQEIRAQKSSAERELTEALEEGEREAAAAGNGERESDAACVALGGPALQAQNPKCTRCGVVLHHCTCA
jgi:hypothetical protein